MAEPKKPVIAVFASGSGSTFQAVADAIHDGLVDFTIGLMVSDHEDAYALERVKTCNKKYGMRIAVEIINKKRYPGGAQPRGQTLDESKAMCDALKDYGIDHLVLMGCLRIIGQPAITEYGWLPEYATRYPTTKGMFLTRITNTHPGILPQTGDTYGISTQAKVLKLGLQTTAHTYHALAAGIDEGPIIAENRVRVLAEDTAETLFARVQRIEKAHLPLDIDAFLKDQALFLQANPS